MWALSELSTRAKTYSVIGIQSIGWDDVAQFLWIIIETSQYQAVHTAKTIKQSKRTTHNADWRWTCHDKSFKWYLFRWKCALSFGMRSFFIPSCWFRVAFATAIYSLTELCICIIICPCSFGCARACLFWMQTEFCEYVLWGAHDLDTSTLARFNNYKHSDNYRKWKWRAEAAVTINNNDIRHSRNN